MKDHNIQEELPSKLPVRIKSGAFEEDRLIISNDVEYAEIPFEKIEYIHLGCVEEVLGTGEAPQSNIRQSLKRMFMGEGGKDGKDKQIKPSRRSSMFLDIYIHGRLAPYRIDSSSVNYKSFLKKMSYISRENFKIFVEEICRRADKSYVNPNVAHILGAEVRKIGKHRTLLDFDEASFQGRDCRAQMLENRQLWQHLAGKEVLPEKTESISETDWEAASSAPPSRQESVPDAEEALQAPAGGEIHEWVEVGKESDTSDTEHDWVELDEDAPAAAGEKTAREESSQENILGFDGARNGTLGFGK